MTEEQLNALEAAAKAATPGPWNTGCLIGQKRKILLLADGYVIGRTWPKRSIFAVNKQCERNAAFIAAANPSAIIELIAELRQARVIAEVSYRMIRDAFDRAAAKEVSCRKN